ncbi:hypothetical protein BH11ARM2_BH11ARM2_26040 [soil metagenome]
MWGRYREMGTDFGRLFGLTDGVFAIVLTILTLNINVPQLSAKATDADVLSKLTVDGHALLGYVVSYFVVGIYWAVHHHMFRMIVRYDRRLLWRNLVFLFLLTLLPFTTSLSTGNSSAKLPWALYCANVVLLGTSLYFMWHYVCRYGHLAKNVSLQRQRSFHIRTSLAPVVFMLSMVVTVFDVHIARLLPLTLLLLGRVGQDIEDTGKPPEEGPEGRSLKKGEPVN